MRTIAPLLIAFCFVLSARVALAVSVQEIPSPRPQNAWVADTVDMIDADAEARLNQLISAIEAEQGVEIAVVTVEDVDTPTPKDFATALFNHWGIGKARNDNGLLVLMVRGQRRLEMETGYGTEAVLTDGWLKSMQQRDMVPEFKAGRFGAGLEAGVKACVDRLRQYPDGIPAGDDTASPRPAASTPTNTGEPPWFAIFGGGGLLLCGTGLGMWQHRKNRTCPTCKVRMSMLSEEEDDEKLEPGQRTEELIGSVDHQFYFCNQCSFTKLIPVGRWFSGYSSCPACGYKACRTTSNTIQAATYESTGLQEVISNCSHCDYDARHTRTLPMLVRSSSSSSSFSSGSSFGGGGGGGGSFGGGSSGGGGAGSSW
jgi:uncharacterized protein